MRHFNAGKKIDYRGIVSRRKGGENHCPAPPPGGGGGGGGGEAVIRLSGHRTGRIAAYL